MDYKTRQQLLDEVNALKQREAFYHAFFDFSPSGVLIENARGIIIDVNKAFCKRSGYSREELIGQPVKKLAHPENRDVVEGHIKSILDGEVLTLSLKSRTKKGDEYYVQLNEQRVILPDGTAGIISVSQDVTDQVLAEKALKESEVRFRSIVETSHAGIILIDNQYHIIYANPRMAEITGYSVEELIQIDFRKLLAPNSLKLVVDRYIRRQKGEKVPHLYELSIIRKDGTIREVENRTSLVDLPGHAPMTVAQLLDITEQKQAERALQASEEKYRMLAETASDFIILHDLKGKIIYANRAAQKKSGFGKKLLQMNILDILPEKEHTQVRKRYKKRIQNTESRIIFETEAVTKAGKTIPVEVNSSAVRAHGQITAILLLARDIRQRKQAVEALKASEQRYRQLFELLPYGGEILDTEGNIIDCSPSTARMLGYDKHELLGKHFSDFLDEESKTMYTSFYPKILKGEVGSTEVKMIHKSGKKLNVLRAAQPIVDINLSKICGVIALSVNITERKQAESERFRLATVVEQAVEAIMITDIKGAIQYVNPAFEQITGYTLKEVLGKNPRMLKSGKQDQAFYENLWATISNGRKWTGLLINKNKAGKLYYERAVIFPIKNEQENIINYAAIMQDITLERKLELQLQQIQKMEAIGTLSGGIAHDFNNLLTVINGHAEIALLHTPHDVRAHKDLIAILGAGQRAEKLTSQLLAFSRKQIHELKVVHINEIIRDLDKMLQRLISEDIHIELQLSENLPFIKADPGQIEQVLINLVVNARDAINEQTEKYNQRKIVIKTELCELDDAYVERNPGSKAGTHIRISVSDTGIGMKDEIKNRVFEPFFTTKQVGKGTGLGLATVYGIVKQNEGSVYLESQLGKGTTFNVNWPVNDELLEKEAEAETERKDFSGTERILLVEDDNGVRNFAASTLRSFGYRVTEARNGEEAVRLITDKQIKKPFHLMVTDLIMPKMNGRDLAERIKNSIHPDKILYVSGYTYEYLQKDGVLKEGIHFLQKPYSVGGLLKAVRHVLDREES